MNQNNQSLEEILFDLAVQKTSAAERAAFLDNVCRDYATLRAALEELLEGHFGGAGFLPKPAAGDPLPLAGREPAKTLKLDFDDVRDEVVGQKIGRYKILERISEGGCGVVYVAEQTEPVRRRVALKVTKLGMDTKAVIARFESERQALAMMDHPNIAKVLDAGRTETGRPYFVMELVRGIRITAWMRLLPQVGLVDHIRRTRVMSSRSTEGLPPRPRDFQRQNRRKPRRCQLIRV
jgi:hypothetical protein